METLINSTTVTPEDLLTKAYAENFPWLENYIRQFSGDAADAPDIFQESIAAAWINLREGRFNGDLTQFNAYLRQICKFKWINLLRATQRKKTVYGDALLLLEKEVDEMDRETERLHQSEVLQKSFAKLGLKCRQVLKLFYYRKKNMNQIALEMGNTEESIKTIKYRCMVQLRNIFLEEMKMDGKI